jgi:hypothetical protein
MSGIDLNLERIEDPIIRENFMRIQESLRNTIFDSGEWKFFQISAQGALTHHKFKHYMGFQPKDVLLTYSVGPGLATFHHELFDKEFLDISTTGPVNLRFFVGTYLQDPGA